MYNKIKNYFKDKIIRLVTDTATKVSLSTAESKAIEIATDISTQTASEILYHVEYNLFVDIDKRFSYSTHIILELIKQIQVLKVLSFDQNDDIWKYYQNKYIGIWLGGKKYRIQEKEPINGFFGAGINCVLSDFSLTVLTEDNTLDSIEVVAFWGQSSHIKYLPFLYLITLKQKKILFVEDGFIYNVFSHTKSLTGKYPKELTIGMSYTIDDITAHFDGSMPSRLEQIIVSGFEVDSLEIDRVKHLIHSIVENKITKYNYQSLEMKRFGKRKNKILVVDQAYGDYSVYKSGATEQVFLQMLNDALIENQDADILVKVHPDMIANPNRAGAKSGGYFGNMNLDNPRIIIIKEEINPFVILEQVQKVYVCTSQLGFEALMSKKQVIIYGVPFYAGWGITIDRGDIEALQRRKNTKRTLEELFWFSYIWYSRYYDPVLKKECSLESILIQLINMRNKILREEDEK